MTTSHPDIAVLDLEGTPDQIGVAHGEAQREQIRQYTDRFLGWVTSRAAIPLTEQTLWDSWAPQVAVNERLAPDLIAEMRGIARGAGVPFERIFLLNSLLDLVRFRYLPMSQTGCSTFGLVSEAGTGRTLLGQTYDLPQLHQDYLVLMRIRPEKGPRQLVFSFAGVVGAGGQNEAGIGVCINFLSPLDVGTGRLHSVVVRQILAGENLADALGSPVVVPRAGGAHFLIADREGNVISVETTAQRHAVFYPEGNVIGHTNHYLSDRLQEIEYIRSDSIGSSLARYAALRRHFHQVGDQLNLESLQQLTRNHTAYPRSICAHGCDGDHHDSRTRTLSAMIHVLDEQVVQITNGCACENHYHPVSL
ncbi:MAG: hypothetical protein CMJ81_12130 [Planctomycetaceae bacterium]|nr:hypothetical protein [Planctomycetaceae bacterium]